MKYIFSVLLFCWGLQLAHAQEVYSSSGSYSRGKKHSDVKGFDPSKIIIGGWAVANFGDGFADLGLFPTVGYRITHNFSAGVGVGYEYLRAQQYLYYVNSATGQTGYKNYPEHAGIISPNVWARYVFWRNLFAESRFEYDIMHFSQYNYDYNSNIVTDKYNVNVPNLLVGGGYRAPIAGRLSACLEVLYDVIQNPNSQYYGRIVPVIGLAVGF